MPHDAEAHIEFIPGSHKIEEVSGIRRWAKQNLLLLLTLGGVISGVILGFALRPANLSPTAIHLFSYPGELMMRILKLLILPLIVSSLIAGSASMNATLNGKIALRTFIYFLLTSILNAALGVIFAVCIHPGNPNLKRRLGEGTQQNKSNALLDSLLDLGRNIIADNIFQATFQQTFTDYENISDPATSIFENRTSAVPTLKFRYGTNTLGIVFFCLFFGIMLGSLGDKSKMIIEFFSTSFLVVMKMVTVAIWLTPLGICSVIIGKILSVANISLVMSQLAWFIATMIIGVFIYQLIIMQLIYFVFLRKNPFKFYLGLCHGTLTAFATASTAAALPITFTLMDNKVKVDPRISRFVLPIGCNINMDGTAMFLAVSSIFIAQMNGVTLGMDKLIIVCFTSAAASFSSASVPSAALALVLIVLSAIDTPVHDVSLLFAVDWLVDRFRTTNNMLGDCYAAAVVEMLSKKELMACDAIRTSTTFDMLNIVNSKIESAPNEVVIHGLLNKKEVHV